MNDILEEKNYYIDEKILSERLNCKVVKVDPRTGSGINDLIKLVREELTSEKKFAALQKSFSDDGIVDIYNNIENIERDVIKVKDKNINSILNANNELIIKGQKNTIK